MDHSLTSKRVRVRMADARVEDLHAHLVGLRSGHTNRLDFERLLRRPRHRGPAFDRFAGRVFRQRKPSVGHVAVDARKLRRARGEKFEPG